MKISLKLEYAAGPPWRTIIDMGGIAETRDCVAANWGTQTAIISAAPYKPRHNHEHWANVWQCALNNMPARVTHKGLVHAPYGTLARCLRLKLYSAGGHYNAHLRVWVNARRGSIPSTAEQRRRLEVLAGPNGKILAWAWLTHNTNKKYQRP